MAIEVLSNEDLVREILLRLPVKPLLRFKCVSKRWLALISDPRFCHSHTLRLYQRASHPFPSALLLRNTDTDASSLSCPIIPLKSSGSHSSTSNFRHVKVPGMSVAIIQSCNGLLLLEGEPLIEDTSFPSKDGYFVYNPTTNQYVAVNFPTSLFGFSVGSLYLSFEPLKSPHYKVISITLSDVVNVYSSETGSWSDPGVCLTATNFPYYNAVYCNGALYWYSNDMNSEYFDVENQCFKTYPMPLGISHEKVKYFGESGGHLHLVVESVSVLDVLDILELNEDRSGWSAIFHVNIFPMLVFYPQLYFLDCELGRSIINTNYCVFRQENEVDFMLVFSIDGSVIAYNLVDSTYREISNASSVLSARSRFHSDVFLYYENLSLVGCPSNAH